MYEKDSYYECLIEVKTNSRLICAVKGRTPRIFLWVNYIVNEALMTKVKIFSLFSLEYAKKENCRNNPILYLMYGVSYPFSYVLVYFRMTPNLITTFSIVFSLLSAIALLNISYGWFFTFWFIAILLDFCDGTVARMTGNFSNRAFDYDHMSDLFKMALMFLSVSLYHSSELIWVLSLSSLFLLLYYTVINHDLTCFYRGGAVDDDYSGESSAVMDKAKNIIHQSNLLRKLFSLFVTIDGHTLFIFFLLPINTAVAEVVLAYLISILLLHIFRNGYRLYSIKL